MRSSIVDLQRDEKNRSNLFDNNVSVHVDVESIEYFLATAYGDMIRSKYMPSN